MDLKRNTDLGHDERVDEFWSYFHDYNKVEFTLIPLMIKAGDFFDVIFGPERCNQSMAKLLGSMAENDPSNWRQELEDNGSTFLTESHVGSLLQELGAYGRFGICLSAETGDDETVVAGRLGTALEQGTKLLSLCPLDDWLGKDRPKELEHTILVAQNRWALDHGQPVDPDALAILGGITSGRMRNMISGKSAVFRKVGGKVPAVEALEWLEGKFEFYPSIWKTGRPGALVANEIEEPEGLSMPIFVPQSRDGTVFHPGLERSGGYTVGEKGFEQKFTSFDEALQALQQTHRAQWRRPGPSGGGWGVVSGAHWVRVTKHELERIAEDFKKQALET